MADDCESKRIELIEPFNKGVRGGEGELRDSQSPSKPAHLSQPEKLTIPPATQNTGSGGSDTSGSNGEKK